MALSMSMRQKPVSTARVKRTRTAIIRCETTTFSSTGVKTKFSVVYKAKLGQGIAVVGNLPSLGSWNPENALPLTWEEGHVWTGECDLPPNTVLEYKYVVKAGQEVVSWAPGDNLVINAPEEGALSSMDSWDGVFHDVQPLADPADASIDSSTQDAPVTVRLSETIPAYPSSNSDNPTPPTDAITTIEDSTSAILSPSTADPSASAPVNSDLDASSVSAAMAPQNAGTAVASESQTGKSASVDGDSANADGKAPTENKEGAASAIAVGLMGVGAALAAGIAHVVIPPFL